MISKYSAAFLIPKNSKRALTNDGWVFQSNTYIPDIVESAIRKELEFVGSDLGISSYQKGNLKIDLIKNKNDELKEIYFRYYDEAKPVLPEYIEWLDVMNELEFFVPSERA